MGLKHAYCGWSHYLTYFDVIVVLLLLFFCFVFLSLVPNVFNLIYRSEIYYTPKFDMQVEHVDAGPREQSIDN